MRHHVLALVATGFGAVAGALVLFVKLHAAQISLRAAMAAVKEFAQSRDADLAAEAALREGAEAATSLLVQDFFRFRFA